MSTFECKDCGVIFPTAKEFVYHVDTCENNYNANTSLQLQNAAILMRALIESANRLANQDIVVEREPRHAKQVKKDVNMAWAWLKANKLQGTLK